MGLSRAIVAKRLKLAVDRRRARAGYYRAY